MKLKKVLGLLFLGIMSLSAYAMAEEPTVEWAKYYSGTHLAENGGRDMAIDDFGNTYVIGLDYTDGIVTIKYDTNGNEKWVRKYWSGSPCSVVVDSSGNVYVVGRGRNDNTWNYTTIKYDSDGNELWVRKYNANSAYIYIAVDASRNVYVTGANWNSGVSDIVTIKYDTNGNELWVRNYSNGMAYPYGMAADSSGNIYVTGVSGYYTLTIIKYDTNGNELWVKRYPEYEAYECAVKVDSSGNVYIGAAIGRWDAAYNYIIMKYDENGNELWSRPFNSGRYMGAGHNCLAVDASGNAFMTVIGWYPYVPDYVTVKYDTNGNQLWINRHSSGGSFPSITVDSFGSAYIAGGGLGVVKYQANGEVEWEKSHDLGADTGGAGAAAGIKVDLSGNVYVAGTSVKNWSWAIQFVTIKYKQCMIKADAGSDQSVVQTSPDGANVVLDGSASIGTDLVYNWTWPGGSATGPNPTVFLPAGVTEVTLEVSNGTCRATDTVSITVHDGTPPVTTPTVTGIHGSNDWYISDVTVALSATDSGSGVVRTEYSTNGTEWFTYTAPFVVGSEGITTIYYRSIDNAGNTETAKSIEVKIDKTLPTLTISATPDRLWSPNGEMMDVTIGGGVFDDGSGVTSLVFTVTDEYGLVQPTIAGFNSTIQLEARREGSDDDGRTYTITVVATDIAGNRIAASTVVLVPHSN